MNDLDLVFKQLEDLSIEQLEQLNRLLEAARVHLPPPGLTTVQRQRRSKMIAAAVARLRDGVTESELNDLIASLTASA